MANPLSGNPICRSCEHRRAQDIQDCAGSNQHCAYQFSKAPLLAWRILTAKPQLIGWPGCVLLLLVSALPIGLFIQPLSMQMLVSAVLLVAIVGVFALRPKTTTKTFLDPQTGASLQVLSWIHSRNEAQALWHSAAVPVHLNLTPLPLPTAVSAVAAASVTSMGSSQGLETLEQAIAIARAVVLELIAQQLLVVQQHDVYSATGSQPLHHTTTIYVLSRTTQPASAAPAQIEAAMLRAFEQSPPGSALSIEAVIHAIYASDVTDPDHHLVMLASQSKLQLSLSERTHYRTAIEQRVREASACCPGLIVSMNAAIEAGIRSRTYIIEHGAG